MTRIPADKPILLRSRMALARWASSPRLSRSAPFVGATALAIVALPVSGSVTSAPLVLIGLAIATLVTLSSFYFAAKSVPAWTDLVVALAYMIGLGLVREGAGGPTSGYAPLILVPVLWLALVSNNRRTAIGLIGMVTVLGLPVLLEGQPTQADQIRRLTLLFMAGAFSVAMVRRLVTALNRAAGEVERHTQRLAEQVAITRAVVDTADDMIVAFDADGRITRANNAVLAGLGWHEDALLGRMVLEALVPEADHERLRADFAGLAAGDDPIGRGALLETEFLHVDGHLVPVEISFAITGTPGTRITHAFARDVSDRRDADRANREHLNDLSRLLAVARDLGGPSADVDGRHAVCEAARELAGADVAIFFEAKPEHRLLVGTGIAGESHVANRVTLDSRTSMTARVFNDLVPEFVGDLETDPRSDHATATRMGVRSAFFQPVVRDGRPIGVLVVYWRRHVPPISERIRSLLALFATQAAGAVERADLMDRLASLARTDSLTGLTNRRALEESLVGELARSERSGHPLSVAMLDLDHFKAYNDLNGHQAGDALLREVAAIWLRELRPSDTLARYGGEEFMAVLPEADSIGARAIAERLRRALPDSVTTSAGVATWQGHETMADLVARADAALYEAKRLGRNRTESAGVISLATATHARETRSAARG